MIKLKNIDNIVAELVWKYEQGKMKKEFFEFAKIWFVKNKDWTCLQKEMHKKYDSTSKKINKLKENFLDKIQKSWFYFCCYCWKDKITHFKEKDWKTKRLYDIEHFLPRSKFPDLSVNLYNWLPVCISCNQRLKKAENPLDKEEIFHPYFGFLRKDWSIDEIQTFDEKYSFIKEDLRKRYFIFNSEHSDFFKLSQIYFNSQDTFNIFNFIQDKRTKIKDEKIRFKKNLKTSEQLKDYFFKNYYPTKEDDILKYSNWKFKKDIIDNLTF